jgi:hypothetical protein
VRKSSPRTVTAFGKTQSIEAWAAEAGLDPSAIRRRLLEGRPAEYAITNHRLKLRNEREMWTGAYDLAWEDDPTARELVAIHGPFDKTHVARMMGVDRSVIHEIERKAMKRFLANARKLGLEARVRDELAELARLRDDRAPIEPEAGGWDE